MALEAGIGDPSLVALLVRLIRPTEYSRYIFLFFATVLQVSLVRTLQHFLKHFFVFNMVYF